MVALGHDVASDFALPGVSAVSPPDAWATGSYTNSRYARPRVRRPLHGAPVCAALGTKWESRALVSALCRSVLLTCARPSPAETRSALVAGMWIHSWGSRGRRFKSGRPDWFFERLYPEMGTKSAMIVPT